MDQELLLKKIINNISMNLRITMIMFFILKIIYVKHVILLNLQEVSIVEFVMFVLVDLIIIVYG